LIAEYVITVADYLEANFERVTEPTVGRAGVP
jgi:hypothetical protein